MSALPAAVLFACTMNSVRSPMAEGILKSLHGSRIYVDSVGVDGLEVNGFAVQVMAEVDVDLSNHKPKTFANLHDTSFDLVIALSPEAQQMAEELTRTMACEVEFWQSSIRQRLAAAAMRGSVVFARLGTNCSAELRKNFRAAKRDKLEKLRKRLDYLRLSDQFGSA